MVTSTAPTTAKATNVVAAAHVFQLARNAYRMAVSNRIDASGARALSLAVLGIGSGRKTRGAPGDTREHTSARP
jgi:hypothetical protein